MHSSFSYVYWSQTGVNGKILRAKYTGEGEETLLANVYHPDSIATDVPQDRLYYTSYYDQYIYVAFLNGTSITKFPATFYASRMALLGKSRDSLT